VITIERSAEIYGLPEDVWARVDDVSSLAEWFAFGDRFEVTEGVGKGRRQTMYGRWGKKPFEVDQRVVDYDPPSLLGWVHEAERLDGKPAPKFAASTHFTIRLEPVRSGTKVTLRSDQQPAGALRGIVMRLFGTREVARSLDESLVALAAISKTGRPTQK
jgi:uncharacterized protein YndB with AHSA1/START domain